MPKQLLKSLGIYTLKIVKMAFIGDQNVSLNFDFRGQSREYTQKIGILEQHNA